MQCERCQVRPATHLMIHRHIAKCRCEVVCPPCIKMPEDDEWALVLAWCGPDMEWANQARAREIEADLREHYRLLRMLGR